MESIKLKLEEKLIRTEISGLCTNSNNGGNNKNI